MSNVCILNGIQNNVCDLWWQVTVEKMLKYQDKIKELRSSQESLLDQLETMENQELTLQQRLEETERRLKGKILQLEVCIHNFSLWVYSVFFLLLFYSPWEKYIQWNINYPV